jgi:hypothetical protein
VIHSRFSCKLKGTSAFWIPKAIMRCSIKSGSLLQATLQVSDRLVARIYCFYEILSLKAMNHGLQMHFG